MNNAKPILYVEDEETDVFLMRIALRRAGVPNPLQVAVDGVEAIDYLSGKGIFGDRVGHPLPGLVLLDINLPRQSGFEVLKWIREQPAYVSLPVILYTSSAMDRDRKLAHQLGANDFVLKKSDLNELVTLIRALRERWMEEPEPNARSEG